MNDNNKQINECQYRTKRIEKQYSNQSNKKLLLPLYINDNNKKEIKDDDNEMENKNIIISNDKDNNIPEFMNENQNYLNISSLDESNNEVKKRYPDFHSFLQLNPKDDIEIPSIKYYNYIFNIGNPSN